MKTTLLLLLLAGLSLCVSAESAQDVYNKAYSANPYFNDADGRQDWVVFFLCRELDALREEHALYTETIRDDIHELRSWLITLLGLGGAGGAAGGARAIKRKIEKKSKASQ